MLLKIEEKKVKMRKNLKERIAQFKIATCLDVPTHQVPETNNFFFDVFKVKNFFFFLSQHLKPLSSSSLLFFFVFLLSLSPTLLSTTWSLSIHPVYYRKMWVCLLGREKKDRSVGRLGDSGLVLKVSVFSCLNNFVRRIEFWRIALRCQFEKALPHNSKGSQILLILFFFYFWSKKSLSKTIFWDLWDGLFFSDGEEERKKERKASKKDEESEERGWRREKEWRAWFQLVFSNIFTPFSK